jgi:hypothetical protein
MADQGVGGRGGLAGRSRSLEEQTGDQAKEHISLPADPRPLAAERAVPIGPTELAANNSRIVHVGHE